MQVANRFVAANRCGAANFHHARANLAKWQLPVMLSLSASTVSSMQDPLP